MGKARSEIGNKYGLLTVIEEAGIDSSKHKLWKCKCDCGNEIIARGSRLRNGEKRDCGCVKKHDFVDETGKRYGRLVVLEIDNNPREVKDRHIYWKCQCDCGKIISVNGRNLRSGNTKSCGCLTKGTDIDEYNAKIEVGHRYGKLTVIDRHIFPNDNRKAWWDCLCDCGNTKVVSGVALRSGNVKSCGCLTSVGEATISKTLQFYNIPYKAQYRFSNLLSNNGGHVYFDFALFDEQGLKCLIEYQGIQHYQDFGKFGALQREETDELKRIYCKKHNISLYEIRYDENIKEKLIEILKQESFEI